LNDHLFSPTYVNALGALPGTRHEWLDSLRQSGRALFGAAGLPTRSMESWRYTSLADLASIPFSPASIGDVSEVVSVPMEVPAFSDEVLLVFVNGEFNSKMSTVFEDSDFDFEFRPFNTASETNISWVRSRLGGLAIPSDNSIVALNSAYMAGGAVLRIGEGKHVDKIVHIVNIGHTGGEPIAWHPRFLFVLDGYSKIKVIESHVGLPGQPYFSNQVVEIYLGPRAEMKRYIDVQEDSEAFHLATSAIELKSDSSYEEFSLVANGRKVRRETRLNLAGERASSVLNGAYALEGESHCDITTFVNHSAVHTKSSQVIKGVLAGKSRGVFQGHIKVKPDAQRVEGHQLHKAILLNRGPEVDCKPELEIYADDVKCSHGATTAELDPEHLFYLMSRGLDPRGARNLLTKGFLLDVVQKVIESEVQHAYQDIISRWLGSRSEAEDKAAQL